MQEQSINGDPVYPPNLNIFNKPNESALKLAYDVYKPSKTVLRHLNEQGRSVYPEVYIENTRLGTLKNLCTAVLARSFGPHPLPIVEENPLLLQVHYDALDVELPLDKCYNIREERFWKRVVLTKHKDKTLAIKPNVNWKNVGVSLKYVELVEKCAAEYWPEEQMKELALKVKDFVSEMHIKHLQSLQDRSFDKKFETESEDSTSEDESSSEIDSETSLLSTSVEEEIAASAMKAEAGDNLELEQEIAKEKAERRVLREAKEKARAAKEAKRKRREARRAAKEQNEKKPLKKIPTSVLEIEVLDSDESENRIVDKRNKALLLRHIKKYNYPAKDCHHIDLRFIQYFTNLEAFTIEFLGPILKRNFHSRHLNFSYDDIKNLSIGLSHLTRLKTFRLRNSRMDTEKLQILVSALATLPCLETLDFGWNQLKDDCGFVFEELFKTTESLKILELESNFLGEQVLQHIGNALKNYSANALSYLGLARNPITDKALHALVSNIIGTPHIEHLNIRGVTFLTDVGLCCCLANEFLKEHPPLIKLDICAIHISPLTADEIIKSLVKNERILEFYCCACDLDEETEIDINVILRRNKYIAENNYLGDPTVTTEDIMEWLNRTRNPIILRVLEEREKHKECLQNRSEVSLPLSHLNSPVASSHASLDIKSKMYAENLKEHSSPEMQVVSQTKQRFIYPSIDFDEQQFLQHVHQPRPQERYHYIKTYKQKYLMEDNVKNKFV